MTDSCAICKKCKKVGIKHLDCCDVEIYKCMETNKRMDQFHVEHFVCNGFIPEDWVKD